MMTRYNFEISKEICSQNIKRLTNQMWKLIPMKEKEEDWEKQLETVILEIVGLSAIFSDSVNYLVLLSKLEGLYTAPSFTLYRKTVFEGIGLLNKLNE